ncbi:type II secretion system protein GspH [Pseudidiomarina gelatinasegens]|uniref:Type II secretion system protein H n=1 Tax=Pseudidiomarina gelatinasegens TaxID=2487740 RepID=A0A443Z7Y6_9GAMM|nr:GspH/FimT family pseudopilin [Pseudidiomarina gelatinasegens]RWU12969.1 type II secretion system protein GspH [Pseudidiomarina gelatinasegens]
MNRGVSKGFTLVEVMVTIAVIAMLAVTVSFVVPDNRDDNLEEDARVLYERIKYAREYALVRNAVLGLRIDQGNSYRFLQFTDGRWQTVNHRGLRRTELDETVLLDVQAADLELLEQDDTDINAVFDIEDDERDADDSQTKSEPTPQLFIFGSGDLPPFELTLSDTGLFADGAGGASWTITSTDGIEISLQREPL